MVDKDSQINTIRFKHKHFDMAIDLKDPLNHYLKGSKILTTMSKNNNINLIIDWVNYYCNPHKIDPLIFYDNNSTEYTDEYLLEKISRHTKLKNIIIIPFNFPYGPLEKRFVTPKLNFLGKIFYNTPINKLLFQIFCFVKRW